jgi:hypothetical protein
MIRQGVSCIILSFFIFILLSIVPVSSLPCALSKAWLYVEMRGLQQSSPAVVKIDFNYRNLATVLQFFMHTAVYYVSKHDSRANLLKYDVAGCSLHYRSSIFL